MKKWTTSNVPDLKEKVVIITGATSGIGKVGTEILAQKNANVVMAVRNTEKGETVANEIRSKHKNASVSVAQLDLSSLKSVQYFATQFRQNYKQLDVLINNAGVMMCPFSRTEDGFEIQMGTNHLGHFTLTGLLMPLLTKTKNSRIVVTSSVAHRSGKLDFSDFNWEKRKYNTQRAYCDSKIAVLYFMKEFQRRYNNSDNSPTITGAHPGWTSTELQRHSGINKFLNIFFGQRPEMGILPTLRAAFDEKVMNCDYYGPSGFLEFRGYPVKVKMHKRVFEEDQAKQLWELSERLTKVHYSAI